MTWLDQCWNASGRFILGTYWLHFIYVFMFFTLTVTQRKFSNVPHVLYVLTCVVLFQASMKQTMPGMEAAWHWLNLVGEACCCLPD